MSTFPTEWLPDRTKFRTSTGQKYTNRLFLEQSYSYPDKTPVQYTLKDKDHNGYKSLYLLYMEMADPTEYAFANKYLDGWSHWKLLVESDWFKPILSRWREELSLVYKSRYINYLHTEAIDPLSKLRFEAQKALFNLSKETLDPPAAKKARVGRPNKEPVTDPESQADSLADWNRINEAATEASN
jgi:hypothetical protein